MILNLKHLLLEVTRACNMACAHCMRGDAEGRSMGYAIVDRIFQDTRHIEHLCLTGGEPSLAPHVISEIVYRARRWRCTIGSFFCATNAKAYSQPFADALTELYRYCTNEQRCTLTVSIDQFHAPAEPQALENYRRLPYYKPVYEHGQIPPYSVLNEGRARENGIGQSEIPIKGCVYDADYTGFRCTFGDTVYINAKGDVLLNADLSYQSQEEFSLGNLDKDDLPHILTTALYIPRFQNGTQVFRIGCEADAGTIAPMKISDQRYYRDERAAMGAYHQMLRNLPVTPTNEAFGKAPETLKLAVEPTEESQLADNRLCQAVVTYTDETQELGSVCVYVERFPLEDMQNG